VRTLLLKASLQRGSKGIISSHPELSQGLKLKRNSYHSFVLASRAIIMDRIFKPPVSMSGAISQDRESCQFLSWLMKNPILDQAARPESGQEARAKGPLSRRSL